MPDDILHAFRMSLDQTRKRNVALFDELAQVIETLAKESIQAIPLSGPVLAIKVHGNLGFFALKDLELAVRDSDIGRAISIMRGLGYERKSSGSATRPVSAPGLRGREIMRNDAKGFIVELQARLAPIAMALDIDYPALWRRATHIDLLGRTILTLAPEDELLILAVQGGKDLWWNVKWACDVAALIAAHPNLNGSELLERARGQGCERMLLLATALARQCFGSAVPAVVVATERADASIKSTAGRIVAHWQTKPTGPPSRRTLAVGRLRLHDGVGRRARYLTRALFSPGPNEVASTQLARASGQAYHALKVARGIVVQPLSNAYRHPFGQAKRWQNQLANSDFVLALTSASAERKRHQDSRADAERVLTTNPKNAGAWDTLGDALFGLKRYKKAIACYEQAIALAPAEWPIRMKAQ